MDFLGGGLMDVSDSSSSSNSPAELQSELGPLRPTQHFYNPSVSHPQIFDMQYNYNISVPTLENQGVPSFGAFIDRMDESSHNDSEEHADSGTQLSIIYVFFSLLIVCIKYSTQRFRAPCDSSFCSIRVSFSVSRRNLALFSALTPTLLSHSV
jgi:hypothetical protein